MQASALWCFEDENANKLGEINGIYYVLLKHDTMLKNSIVLCFNSFQYANSSKVVFKIIVLGRMTYPLSYN